MMVRMLIRPRALLLDFGGVIADAPSRLPAREELVRHLVELTGGAVSAADIATALATGASAHSVWRDTISDESHPVELSHVQVWDDFVTPRWPAAAREAVRNQATPLAYAWTRRPEWQTRPGIPEVLRAAADTGLPVAVVSNTLCGAAHRDYLTDIGLTGLFQTQFYSDEIGIRKPNPDMARRAAQDLGVPVDGCWFVGDTPDRDIACARRAGVGAAVLMRSRRTDRTESTAGDVPDAIVDDGHGLLALLVQALAVR